MVFFFRRVGAAEELADAPEAIDMPMVLWHMARCTGAEDFDFRLDLHKIISFHRDNVVLQEFLFPVLRFLDLPGLLKFPFLFINEVSQYMTLTRSAVHLR